METRIAAENIPFRRCTYDARMEGDVVMGFYVFMRHGKAVPASVAGSDEERWLTEEGRKDVALVAKLIPFMPKVVYTSPLRRARETAEIIAQVRGGEVKVVEQLSPGMASCEAIEELGAEPETVFVGHAPSIELIVSCLIGGGAIKIKAGGFALVEAEELSRGQGELVELVTPRIARVLTGES
jgi:phosphohistidine phosphatase